ncbi:MAG: 3-oxoacyl-ACP synthase [Gammaproteobacteria bacterium]|nr:3-oxoacyl-ACP synthase [Gammaproteobacteria bacterium]
MLEKRKSLKSDLKRVDKLREDEIDYSDSPPLDDSFFERATVEMPIKKDQVTLRIDHAVLDWFKGQGKGYQTRINAILKAYWKAHRSRKS